MLEEIAQTGEHIRTPRGSFALTDLSKEQMEAAGYGVHHHSNDGRFHIMGNGTRVFAVANAEIRGKDNPLKTAEMTVENDYGMIDGIINNGRRDEVKEKTSIRERLAKEKRKCAERPTTKRGAKDAARPSVATYEQEQEMAAGVVLLPGGKRQATVQQGLPWCVHDCKQSFRVILIACPRYISERSKKCSNGGSKTAK